MAQPLPSFVEPLRLPSVPRAEGVDRASVALLQERIERLLDRCDEGVYGVDREGRATLVTPAAAAMTGHAVDELVGRTMHEVLHHSHPNGECYPREQCPIYAAFRDGKVHRAEEVFWRKDGSSFPIEYTSTPVLRGDEIVGAVVVFRDLEERRETRERIRRMLGELGPRAAGGVTVSSRALVGESVAWQSTMRLVRRVASVDTTVLLVGESGTGKEPVARALHELGGRAGRPLVKVNCAAIPATLIESELFGHERGAFTGATGQRIGRFEQAGDGTLFLDEIGELPLEAQAKLLRVLQERELERLGGTRTIPVHARVVAATNRDLQGMVVAGRFRADLYYRLNVFPIRLPPLRERREDIPLLVRHFVARLAPRLGRPLQGFTSDGQRRLAAYDWPGNVRELENIVERAALLSDDGVLEVPELDSRPGAPDDERTALVRALERCGGRITGSRGAAAALGIHPNTLRERMKRLGLQRPAK